MPADVLRAGFAEAGLRVTDVVSERRSGERWAVGSAVVVGGAQPMGPDRGWSPSCGDGIGPVHPRAG